MIPRIPHATCSILRNASYALIQAVFTARPAGIWTDRFTFFLALSIGAPHPLQNLTPSLFALPHFSQYTVFSSIFYLLSQFDHNTAGIQYCFPSSITLSIYKYHEIRFRFNFFDFFQKNAASEIHSQMRRPSKTYGRTFRRNWSSRFSVPHSICSIAASSPFRPLSLPSSSYNETG